MSKVRLQETVPTNTCIIRLVCRSLKDFPLSNYTSFSGYVSETNATNVFMVEDGVLLTPSADHCLPGITRATVLEIAKELNIPTEVRRISLAEFHAADEVFTTGTMGELTPVTMIDGRIIGSGSRGPITQQLQDIYKTLPERGEPYSTRIPDFE